MKKSVKTMLRKVKKSIKVGLGITKKDTFSEKPNWEKHSTRSRIWMLGTEDFGNLGDHKIAVAEKHFFNTYFPDYEYIEVSARNYFAMRQKVIESVAQDDIVVSTGGGNLGNKYPFSEKIHQDIAKTFVDNRVIIMPQTIWYTTDEAGQKSLSKAVKIYGGHKRLLLAVREEKSYQFAKEKLGVNVVLVPDIVLFDGILNNRRKEPANSVSQDNANKAVVCLRNDLEAALGSGQRKAIIKTVKGAYKTVKRIDTQKSYCIAVEQRQQELEAFFQEIKSADLVVTDRLHGMIFAAISQVPCIVYDNSNGKVKGVYEWIKELPYILYRESCEHLQEDILTLKSRKDSPKFQVEGLEEKFAWFADCIRDL